MSGPGVSTVIEPDPSIPQQELKDSLQSIRRSLESKVLTDQDADHDAAIAGSPVTLQRELEDPVLAQEIQKLKESIGQDLLGSSIEHDPSFTQQELKDYLQNLRRAVKRKDLPDQDVPTFVPNKRPRLDSSVGSKDITPALSIPSRSSRPVIVQQQKTSTRSGRQLKPTWKKAQQSLEVAETPDQPEHPAKRQSLDAAPVKRWSTSRRKSG